MIRLISVLTLIFSSLTTVVDAQSLLGTEAVADVDSSYIRTFTKRHDIRAFYGAQGNRSVLGSLRDGSPDLTRSVYNNTNDFLGLGLTYKWLDFDASFSLAGTTYLNEERSNLEQFRLSGSYTRRKVAYRGYISDSKGMVISGNEEEYESAPSLHDVRIGVQATIIFNAEKYSYRAALYQSELQTQTAGSFLLRIEPFFRDLGSKGQTMIPEPYDLRSRFDELVGLTYVKAPGLLVMPGYGVTFVSKRSKVFVSPIVLAGAGAAFNQYEADSGKGSYTNMEYAMYFLMNAGYNGSQFYSRVQFTYSAGYSPLQPAYLSNNSMMLTLLAGYRFERIMK